MPGAARVRGAGWRRVEVREPVHLRFRRRMTRRVAARDTRMAGVGIAKFRGGLSWPRSGPLVSKAPPITLMNPDTTEGHACASQQLACPSLATFCLRSRSSMTDTANCRRCSPLPLDDRYPNTQRGTFTSSMTLLFYLISTPLVFFPFVFSLCFLSFFFFLNFLFALHYSLLAGGLVTLRLIHSVPIVDSMTVCATCAMN